jgi:D-beta-D-heptose 7-phosphate kinase/D-beta-D-heptose 1-phosphate adenosyltransferase
MIDAILNKFTDAHVAVVGDVMLDRYWWGDAVKISPEAPVPVVRMHRSSVAVGGAANVAANLSGLGVRTTLIGVIGEDAEGKTLSDELRRLGIESRSLVTDDGRPTTAKTRVIAHSQQVTRIDHESQEPISPAVEKDVLELLTIALKECDAIVVSDYAKGLLTEKILTELMRQANALGKPVLVDPKGKSYGKYSGAAVITPNRHEAADACGISESEPDFVLKAGERLLSELSCGAVLITRGEEGMSLFERHSVLHLPTSARRVYDVTGAGDTVIATLAACLAAGADLPTSSRVANLAAGIVVESVGTTHIRSEDLRGAVIDE